MKKTFFVHFLAALFISLFVITSHAQEYRVFGKVYDASRNRPLEYVNVKVADSTYGTAADKNGSYFLKLTPGEHRLIFSYIGYFSDTADVFVQDSSIERNIYLRPSEIMTDVIEVLGEDPAYDIIRKAIKYKKLFREKLNEYHYDAYTKYIIRSNQSPIASDSLTKEKYPIIAILESETDGYFRKPDKYKEIVRSKQETANITRGFAIPYIVNFYDETLDLNNSKVTCPLADDALDHYEYKLLGTTSINNTKVFMIRVDGSGLLPMFNGKIYIADSTFALMKVDLSVNEAAKPTGIDELSFKQKFTGYTDKSGNSFWLPTDIQIYAEGGLAGIFTFTGDVFTIISNYELNKKAPPGVFDEYAVKVLPNAQKDSSYWSEHRLVGTSSEENHAFKEFDKRAKEPKNILGFGLTSLRFGKYITSYPLNFYHYNRVEGSHLQFNLSFTDKNRRTMGDGYFGYGFSDKKSKYEINLQHTLGKKREFQFSISAFKKLQPLSFDMSGFFSLYNTLMGLFDKQDLFDYYYSSGAIVKASFQPVPQISAELSFRNEKQTSAFKNTDYSFRKKDQPFRGNPLIKDGALKTMGISFTLDPNKYKFIDYGDGEVSRFTETSYPEFNFGFEYSPHKIGSTFEYRKYFASISGENYFNRFFNVRYRAGLTYMNGEVPVQSLAYFNSLNGNLQSEFAFHTMGYREYLGEKLYYVSIENNFGPILPVKLGRFGKISLIGFFNAGRIEMSTANSLILNSQNYQTDKTFMEAGFGIGGILDIIRIDFAWRLNNKKAGRNFNFSLTLFNF